MRSAASLTAAEARTGLAGPLEATPDSKGRVASTTAAATARERIAGPEHDIRPSIRAIETTLAEITHDLIPASQATTQRLADIIAQLNTRLDRLVDHAPAAPDPDGMAKAEAGRQSTAGPPADAALPIDRAGPAAGRVSSEPAEAARSPTPPKPPVSWPATLSDALAEIAARQRDLDTAGAAATISAPASRLPDMSWLERQLRTITEQIESLRRPCVSGEAILALRQDLAEISRKLNEALPRNVLESFQSEIRALGERIAIGAQRGADAEALAGIERKLDKIRLALDALTPAENLSGFGDAVEALSRKIELVGENGAEPDALKPLELAVSELRGLAGRIASGETVSALAAEIRVMGERLDRFTAEADRAAEVEQRSVEQIEQLTQRMEGLAASMDARLSSAAPSVPTELEDLLRNVTEKLDTTASGSRDPAAFIHLEQRIIALAQKLDASEARLGNLPAVEHSIGELMVQLKDARASAIEAAQTTARAVAREMLGARTGTGDDVEALRRDVAQLRATQADIDRRTAGTLESVHETLKRLVEQMASIEAEPHAVRAQAPTRAGPAASGAAPFGAPARAAAPERPTPAAASRLDPALVGSQPPHQSRAPLDPTLPGDHPLEPGSGSPRRMASAAERIAASEAALAAAKPQGAELSPQASFIAAARRAAQAAAETVEVAEAEAGTSVVSRLGAIGEIIAKRRRQLLIGVGVVVVIFGTLHLVLGLFDAGDQPQRGPAPAAVTAPRAAPSRPDLGVPRSEPAPPATPAPSGSAAPEAPAGPTTQPAGTDPASPPTPAQPGATPDRRSQFSPDDSLLSPTPMIAGAKSGTGDRNGQAAAPATSAVRDVTGSLTRAYANQAPANVAPPAGAGTATPDKLPDAIGGTVLRNAAAAGNAAAEFEVAMRFSEGRGVPQSFETAARWFERAADQGSAPAQFRLGSLYEKGQGVKKDLETARRLYVAAADKGNAKAMHNLAVLYAEGVDGKPDYKAASQWFRKAADRGVADSQYNLGILYARGIGLEQNLPESYKWFALAAQQGDQDAGKKRDDVASRLDAPALASAKAATQTWTAEPQPDEAVIVKAPPGGWDAAAVKAKVSTPGHLGARAGTAPHPDSNG